jgi:dimethylargininase
MLTVITRKVSSSLANCELSFIERKPIDLEKARAQHHAYEALLEKLGAKVISLPEEKELPDSMFVEDPAIVLDEVAIICPLGTETRRKEAPSLATSLEPFRKLAYVKLPGMLEGGDVLRVGKKIFVGLTQRSNAEGIRQLAVIAEHYGYELTVVPVPGCLHLKSAVTYLGRNTLLGNRAWFHWKRFEGFEWLDVDPAEPHAGNALAIGECIVFPASFPKTRARLEANGFRVESLDISELQKAESGLTCSSLLFDSAC